MGRRDTDLAVNGYAHSYFEFTEDQTTNTVWAYARNRLYRDEHGPGEMGFSVWKYDDGDRTWDEVGGIPTGLTSGMVPTYNALFWADGAHDKGNPTQMFYQGIGCDLTFDHNGDLHVAVAFAVGIINDDNPTHMFYAKSTDEGATWEEADGTTISGLPITNVNGDVVVSVEEDANPFVSVAGQENGDPIIMMHSSADSQDKFYRYNGNSWIQENTPIDGTTKNFVHVGNDGVYTMIRHNNNDIERTRDIAGEDSYPVTAQASKTCCIKLQAIREAPSKGDVFWVSPSSPSQYS